MKFLITLGHAMRPLVTFGYVLSLARFLCGFGSVAESITDGSHPAALFLFVVITVYGAVYIDWYLRLLMSPGLTWTNAMIGLWSYIRNGGK